MGLRIDYVLGNKYTVFNKRTRQNIFMNDLYATQCQNSASKAWARFKSMVGLGYRLEIAGRMFFVKRSTPHEVVDPEYEAKKDPFPWWSPIRIVAKS